jgi:DNA-binding NtrC family response regulator
MDRYLQQLLLVSNDDRTLEALSRAIGQDGRTVTTARTWAEMLTKVESAPVSVIVYDVMDVNETERKRLLLFRVAHPEFSMILLSSLESDDLHRAATEGLIAAYLMKPLSLTKLEECLDTLWTQRQVALA